MQGQLKQTHNLFYKESFKAFHQHAETTQANTQLIL